MSSLRFAGGVRPVAMLAAALFLLDLPGPPAIAAPHAAPEPGPGDSKLFDTWTGYQSGRYLEGVVAGDFNADGAPDVAWARQDFGQNRMMVQLNLGDGTLAAPWATRPHPSRTTSGRAISTATATWTWRW
jgi:hypothetical protein